MVNDKLFIYLQIILCLIFTPDRSKLAVKNGIKACSTSGRIPCTPHDETVFCAENIIKEIIEWKSPSKK